MTAVLSLAQERQKRQPHCTDAARCMGCQREWTLIGNLIEVESKEDMKKRGLPSPNRADSLILTFAYPVASRRVSNPRNKVITDYDPFA